MTYSKAPKDVNKYQKHFSESGFWKKVSSLGKHVLKPALLLYYVMKSPKTPTRIKLTIVGALGYLILPTDLIPDFIPVAGYTDDIAALWMVIKQCKAHITPEIETQTENKLKELIG